MKWHFFKVEYKQRSMHGDLHYGGVYRIQSATAEQAEEVIKKEMEAIEREGVKITPCESYLQGSDFTTIRITDPVEASEQYRALAYEESEIKGRIGQIREQMRNIRKGMADHIGHKKFRIYAGVLWEGDTDGVEATAAELEMEPDFSHQNQ